MKKPPENVILGRLWCLSVIYESLNSISIKSHGGVHQTMATKAATGRKRMTQSEVFNHFAEKTGMKRASVKEFFDELYNLASREVKTNGEFVLPGFGKLVKSERKAREGRNPATGETIQIPAKTTLKFRVGKGMKDTVLPKK
ncbi:MAG TPA: HU family DNA-binding protein [Pyrinomonadaceae bacterium]|nr:HU family DNA-binding protein [Pyrinomonadaceae bacterium]